MQEHPVPQNITSFEFKLIGDMTLRQFGYVGTGIALALIFFFAKPLPALVRFPFIILCPSLGFALAFMPVEGRSLDRWLVSFINAVFGNTLYVWKKEGVPVEALHDINTDIQAFQQPQAPMPQPDGGLANMPLQQKQKPKNALDEEELRVMGDLSTHFTNQEPRPPIAPTPTSPVTPLVPPTPVTKTYAGPATPLQALKAQPTGMTTTPAMPTVMRQPHQKPLVPKNIPLPSYQAATIRQVATTPVAAPVSPLISEQKILPTDVEIKPLISHNPNPISHMSMGTTLTPPQASMYQQAARELAMLKQQNELLFNKLKYLEETMQHTIGNQALAPEQTGSLTAETQSLNGHIASLENTLRDVLAHVDRLSANEAQYKELLAQVQSQLTKVAAEKDQAVSELSMLRSDSQTTESALKQSETARNELENKLKELEEKLKEAQTLSEAIEQAGVLAPPVLPSESQQEPAHPAIAKTPAEVARELQTAPVVLPKPKELTRTRDLKTIDQMAQALPDKLSKLTQSLPQITNTPNAVSGYVFDEAAKPIMDVIVVVRKEHGPTVRALKTNRVGQFSIVSPLLDGKYELSFEKDGYAFTELKLEANGQVIPPLRVLGKRIS